MGLEINVKLDCLLALSAENEVVEFKEAKNDFDFKKLCKYFSALCNEANLKGAPAAWLVFGVNNRRQVVGSNFRLARKDLDHLKGERQAAQGEVGQLADRTQARRQDHQRGD